MRKNHVNILIKGGQNGSYTHARPWGPLGTLRILTHLFCISKQSALLFIAACFQRVSSLQLHANCQVGESSTEHSAGDDQRAHWVKGFENV